ncbi:hypothetical protein DFJ58DRAFT_856318 [Suillus subalutaceus]|uniref:uncharacterized protein n=1 Tax=Suillus subalutaceus TaxID=48586 RepID=UPI001B873D57|nr:uncharacterized protein DFJ58DRAFT_856318 [Suillus subalutaceus]KAG1841650.1 hypothetical protein DFJ58DRAFT_856318 [Suillus subalutaceus]
MGCPISKGICHCIMYATHHYKGYDDRKKLPLSVNAATAALQRRLYTKLRRTKNAAAQVVNKKSRPPIKIVWTEAIALSRGSVPSNSPLDLRPQFSKVPPCEKYTPWPKHITQVHTPAPSRISVSGGWQEDPLTKESGFVDREQRSNGLSSNGSLGDDIDLTNGKQNDDGGQFDDNKDLSDVFTGGETYHDLHHLKHVRLPPSDDEGDSTQSHKRMLLWAKEAWKEACSCYEMEMGFNGKIIQMITQHTSHLTSEVKVKVRLLIENIYGFESTNRESIKCRNRKRAHQLKDKFGLCYRDLGDKKNNVPRSGLFQSRLNQQAANLLWYCNKDEGIVFEKFFSPFPMPALALVYTAAECCIDEWSDSEQVDISFSSGDYREVYDKHLANLKKFDTRTKDHGTLDGILTELNNNGRSHAKVDPIDVRDGDRLSDDEINKAIREYQQGSGADGSDEVESDLESEGGQFEVDEVEAE